MAEERQEVPARRRALVTGCAGFIGSHLVERLLANGWFVDGVDDLDPWYAVDRKRRNLASALLDPGFRFHQQDLGETRPELLADVDVVFHLAGRPGVQDSWGAAFTETSRRNVTASQRLFELAIEAGAGRVVLASSSSVYGQMTGPTARAVAPVSPYGVSKAAAEQLAQVYDQRGLGVVVLRYFTVFGPRQRPDMALQRLLTSCRGGAPFPKRGDGWQRRELTYVDDVVAATVAAGSRSAERVVGRTFDVGGGCDTSLNEVIATVAEVTGRAPAIVDEARPPGDPERTTADLGPITEALDWEPSTTLTAGLAAQWRHVLFEDAGSTGPRPMLAADPLPVVAPVASPTPA